MAALPRYPIYVISKGRADACLTARFLRDDNVPFSLVVEPQEAAQYVKALKLEQPPLVLPFSNLGQGSIPARNWVWEHALSTGAARHWILDDNIRKIYRQTNGRRVSCASGPAFAAIEDFVDRYENVAIAGMNYDMFGQPGQPPFYLNVHVYSSLLILNALPNRWRGRYNEDTDICLQVLTDGWCTVLMNAFMIKKTTTMTAKGGNTDVLYAGDGRLKMARSLERAWPGVVETKRKWKRPQHHVKDQWRKFDTPLKRRADVDFSKLEATNEYGMTLKQIGQIDSERTKQWLAEKIGGEKQENR